MSSTYTGLANTVPDSLVVQTTDPVDGDAANAASVNTAFQKIDDILAKLMTTGPIQWNEFWMCGANIANTAGGLTNAGERTAMGANSASVAWPWWVFSSVATGLSAQTVAANGTVTFPHAQVKPGTANTHNGWIATAPYGAAGSGAFFYTNNTLMRAAFEWTPTIDIVGANNVTFNMGLDDAANTSTCFANNAAVGSYFQFRKKSTDTNWQCVTGTSGGSETTTDIVTGGGTMPGASVWVPFRITWDGTTGSQKVTYFVNGVQVAQHTTNIPANTAMRFAFGGTDTGAAAAIMYMGCVRAALLNVQ
jgi:hypothetical protein